MRTEYIECRDHRVFFKKEKYNEKKKVREMTEKEVTKDLISYFGEYIEIKDNFTLGDLLKHLKKYNVLLDLFFATELGYFKTMPFFVEAERLFDPDKNKINREEKIEYLEICWNISVNKYKQEKELSVTTDFGGRGKTTCWGIEFTPLNELATYPLKLTDKISIMYDDIDNIKKVFNKVIFKDVEYGFRLRDVIGAILFEISYCGYPKDRNKKWTDLKDRVKKAKKNLKKVEK
jgi:hypothetical protein